MHRYFEINEGGHNIRCKIYCHDLRNIRRSVICCHGFGSSKDNFAAEKLADRILSKYKAVALVTFDLPAHGDDVKKRLTLADCERYLALVIDHVKLKFGAEEIYCHGVSFGGYLTLKYISEHGNPFRRIALRCPAVNMYEVITANIITPEAAALLEKGRDVAVGFEKKVLINQAFLDDLRENDIRTRDFLDYAEDIRIIQGTEDETVPFAAVQAFAEEQLIEFIPVEGADHRFRRIQAMGVAIREILAFYEL